MPLTPLGSTRRGVVVSDLTFPVFIGHRGAANLFPENTMEGFEAAIASGCKAIEAGDVYTLADGSALGVMHDTTVDRTSTGTGNVADLTAGSFQNLTLDAGAWLGGGWGNLKPPLFQSVVNRIGGRVVSFPESKDGNSAAKMAARINAAGVGQSFVICSFNFADASAAVAAGVQACYLDTDGTTKTPSQIVAAGIQWVCVDFTAVSAPTVSALKAAGLKVLAYTVNRQSEKAAAVALGITDGYFSDDPIYIQGTVHRRTTDPFKAQTFYHGHLPYNPAADPTLRGAFTAPGDWGYTDSTSAFYKGSLQGWACPLANAANSYTITLSMVIDAVNGGDTTRWGSVFLGAPDDRAYANQAVAGENGYHVLFRANGNLDLFKVVNGVATSIGSKTTGVTALTLGSTVATYTIAVTPTTINVSRTDVAYSIGAITDSTVRGAYFHLGRNAASVRFRNVSIT